MVERIQRQLERHGYTGCVDISETHNGEIHIFIEWGDWKHDHLYVEYLCKLMGLIPVKEVVTEEDGSDCYSAINIFKKRDVYRITVAGSYTGALKQLAKDLKKGNETAVGIAARQLLPLLPKDAVLIPMPSHDGMPNFSTALCNELSRLTGRPVCEALGCKPHESLCEIKKAGRTLPYPEELMFVKKEHNIPKGTRVIIDNVIASGTTAVAALNAMVDDAMVLALADDEDCPKIPEVSFL